MGGFYSLENESMEAMKKIEACSCYKQDKNSKKGKYKSLQFYSPPNVKETIGNKDLLI